MPRLEVIDPAHYAKLDPTDRCWHIGEYTSGGGWQASETNRQIYNLKWRTGYFHDKSIAYWADQLAAVLDLKAVAENVTMVPAPPSKPPGHEKHSDRMQRVLATLQAMEPGLDVRSAIVTCAERDSQHEHGRLSVADLATSMKVVQTEVRTPLKRIVLVVDDVFTQGGTFKAMQQHLVGLRAVEHVRGLFLAKTVWPVEDF